MTEIDVKQRSAKWFELRKTVLLTASRFGDAIGVGRGKPYHFLASLLSDDVCNNQNDDTSNDFTAHGVAFEPVLNECYQLLTGYTTCDSGFWVPSEKNALYNLVGASPDAKVYASVQGTRTCIGLAEYKAPVYQMYQEKETVPHSIPRMYMAQMQGQMAVSGHQWCDFLAICERSRDIQLKRVYFNTAYWAVVTTKLRHFCQLLQKAKARKLQNLDPLDFVAAAQLKNVPLCLQVMPEERFIKVENLLECDAAGRYRSLAGIWMTFDFLVGNSLYDCHK